ncbi:MAG: hypothetical protein A2231_09055 [Candidatus Firestonebacteria bacterium RIFOXYA2_FULL_40_8]|nr:MAG: hypothetical protein A2231_09055 [Candidatus Firestonebacteria bacterium RIFOXYA2_FULL_40_8]
MKEKIINISVILFVIVLFGSYSHGADKTPENKQADTKPLICKKWNPGHYVFASFGSTPKDIEEILSNPNNHIKGIQIVYSWRDLEPKKDTYNFSTIEEHLKIVKKYNKQLFISFSERKFHAKDKPVPAYLYDDPKYKGGAVTTKNGGSVARIWDLAIMERSNKLIDELGKKVDNDPNIEGITFAESSLDINIKQLKNDYNDKAYADALIFRIDAAAKAFPNSVVLMDMNWGPSELVRVFEHLLKSGVGLGCPDLVPDQGRFAYKPRIPAYDFYTKYAGSIPLSVAVQSENLIDPAWYFQHCSSRPNDAICKKDKYGNYEKRKGDFTLDGFWDMGLNTLKVNYIFWCYVEESRYKFRFMEDILPYINKHKGEINETCPKNVTIRR